MKKQILSIIMAGCLLLSMTACSSDKKNTKSASEQTTADTSTSTNSPQEYSKTDFVMSTVLSEKIYGTKDVTQDIKEELDKLEKELLAQNAQHKDWACTEELMKTTKDGKALYLHCLPADITGVSCETGEVDASVFDRYRIPLYKEASFKPYVIAAMIMLSKFENPQDILKKLEVKAAPRIME